jgi:hypothetical protein
MSPNNPDASLSQQRHAILERTLAKMPHVLSADEITDVAGRLIGYSGVI